jgi:hypothetical protein
MSTPELRVTFDAVYHNIRVVGKTGDYAVVGDRGSTH